ncbi:MAG TPA: hypothetical protein DEG28_09260 [Porphyromonadaceae bacterium]|nr:hypothetical protein [Porphyromonadaceae bacterium]
MIFVKQFYEKIVRVIVFIDSVLPHVYRIAFDNLLIVYAGLSSDYAYINVPLVSFSEYNFC